MSKSPEYSPPQITQYVIESPMMLRVLLGNEVLTNFHAVIVDGIKKYTVLRSGETLGSLTTLHACP
jgi:hypothetical protein